MFRVGLILSISLHATVIVAGGFLISGNFKRAVPAPIVYEVELVKESAFSQQRPASPSQEVPASPPVKVIERHPPKAKKIDQSKIKSEKAPASLNISIENSGDPEPAPTLKDTSVSQPSSPGLTAGFSGNPLPHYPESARRKLQEGVVLLNVVVSRDGSADSVSVAKSSEVKVLDDAAIDAVSRWHFKPAQANDRAVPSSVQIPIRFKLK